MPEVPAVPAPGAAAGPSPGVDETPHQEVLRPGPLAWGQVLYKTACLSPSRACPLCSFGYTPISHPLYPRGHGNDRALSDSLSPTV